jgi:hypothetical protein
MSAALKTIEFDLDANMEPGYLSNSIQKEHLHIGKDALLVKFLSNHTLNSNLYAGLLLLLSDYLFHLVKSDNKNTDNSLKDKMHDEYLKYSDIRRLETKIENAYKIQIEFEKRNPLDEVFGIWKTEDISLDKIRKKAWRHNR